MIFLTYDFVWFAVAFFGLYWSLHPFPPARLAVLVVAGLGFQYLYGGAVSLVVTATLSAATYLAGRSGRQMIIMAAICLCMLSLIYSKYTPFIAQELVAHVYAEAAQTIARLAPAAIPLGISFFTFEFVHYLVDIRRGHPPLRRWTDFAAFSFFWPTMIAGPVKRYEPFTPSLHQGLRSRSPDDITAGLTRFALGFVKKWAADNLTGWIDFMEPALASQSAAWRWAFLIAIAARILLDFSGYSDMAIGLARLMGITVPENFNWPYLATSPVDFWNRWRMSLTSWIRDYVYIPLGGNRRGLTRQLLNAVAAMGLCGLWHGASWHFAVWGLYHGVGVGCATLLQAALPGERSMLGMALGWTSTMLFVLFGWLLFFYPLDRAWQLAALIVMPRTP